MKTVGELEGGEARGFRHRDMIAALDYVEVRGRDRKPALFDVVGNVLAVLVEQNRSAEHQLQIDLRMIVQLADEELTAAVIGAARDRKTDPALSAPGPLGRRRREQGIHHTFAGSWLTTTVFHSQ